MTKHYIYNSETKMYFGGWFDPHPVWTADINLAKFYDSTGEADSDYEELKESGYAVMVEG